MVTPLFRKLNFKNQPEVLLVNPPDSFLPEIRQMQHLTKFTNDLGSPGKKGFILAFVTRQEQVNELSTVLVRKTDDNSVFWFAYPKQTSKKYKCDFNRDNGWKILESLGFGSVRMVAIDDDWSALRFRKFEK
jgi:hypothetical protein